MYVILIGMDCCRVNRERIDSIMTIMEFLRLPTTKQCEVLVCSKFVSSQLRIALTDALNTEDYNTAAEILELLSRVPIH